MGEDEIKRFQVTIPRSLYVRFDRLTSRMGLRKTDILRELIETWLAEHEPTKRETLNLQVIARHDDSEVCLAAFAVKQPAREFAEEWHKSYPMEHLELWEHGRPIWVWHPGKDAKPVRHFD